MSFPLPPRLTRDTDSVATIAKWIRRCGLPFAILAWTGVALLILWLAGHIAQTLLLLTIAALLAYALTPVVKILARVMPHLLAILIVYLVILGALSAFLYLIIRTAIVQFGSLADYVRVLLTPEKSGQLTPWNRRHSHWASRLIRLLRSVIGLSQALRIWQGVLSHCLRVW